MNREDRKRRTLFARSAVAAAAVLAAGVCLPAAEVARMQSAWAGQSATVDGDLAEWEGQLARVAESEVSIGVRNDAEFLYVALAASDPGTRMLLGRAGFTLWWDVKGKTAKDTGVVVPAVIAPPDPAQQRRSMSGDESGERGEPPQRDASSHGERRTGGPLPAPPMSPLGHLIVVGPKKDDQRRLELAFLEKFGVAAAAAMREGVLSYELKMPLAKSDSASLRDRRGPGGVREPRSRER